MPEDRWAEEHPELVNAGRRMFARLRELMGEPDRIAMMDMIAAAAPPDVESMKSAEPQPQSTIDPRITAEKLLMRVLPPDLYAELNAVGQFSFKPERTEALPTKTQPIMSGMAIAAIADGYMSYFTGPYPPFTYIFYRKRKTEQATENGRRFSACIAPEDAQCPDQDRLVAEFLMVKNREQEYLQTANLTEITPNQSRGDTVRVQMPARHVPQAQRMDVLYGFNTTRPNTNLITTQMMAAECIRLFESLDELRGVRYPIMGGDGNIIPMHHVDMVSTRSLVSYEALELPMDQFSTRFLYPAVRQLVESIRMRMRNLVGIQRLELTLANTGSSVMWSPEGWCVRVSQEYDVTMAGYQVFVTMGLVCRP